MNKIIQARLSVKIRDPYEFKGLDRLNEDLR